MSELIRTFIALPVPESVKNELRHLQNELREQLPNDAVRWTRPEQFHLTLKFLGNIPTEGVGELTKGVRGACAGFASIALNAKTLDFFPSRGLPRVIWVSVHDEQDELLRLQRAVEAASARFIGQAEEPDYTGHLTIGRAKSLKPADGHRLRELAEQFKSKSFGNWRADKIEIMRSELGPDGSRHSLFAEIALGGC